MGPQDWEAWNPDWDVNSYAEYQIYQNRSIELVLSQHPGWSVAEATPVAKQQFEAAAKALWLETLALAKALRPHGKWGWCVPTPPHPTRRMPGLIRLVLPLIRLL